MSILHLCDSRWKTVRPVDATSHRAAAHSPVRARQRVFGEDPGRGLPVARLVALAGLFGINENQARVALSRMVARKGADHP